MSTRQRLEHAALDAHADGQSWGEYWAANGDQVREAEPWDRTRYHRLVERLLCLVVAGDTDGHRGLDGAGVFGDPCEVCE